MRAFLARAVLGAVLLTPAAFAQTSKDPPYWSGATSTNLANLDLTEDVCDAGVLYVEEGKDDAVTEPFQNELEALVRAEDKRLGDRVIRTGFACPARLLVSVRVRRDGGVDAYTVTSAVYMGPLHVDGLLSNDEEDQYDADFVLRSFPVYTVTTWGAAKPAELRARLRDAATWAYRHTLELYDEEREEADE
ncbi:hypothetical protein [Deinococcus pimensis]|uniref:hypothetical protein n=1 Tax=Deinococcus pimensis TaxID=309888 RepID=UPI00048A0348|nr:hypothetical protein [Deinococcus pimensis]